nr:putative ribonuclease H-like domain-containing protein [Tanacetum cinerariifolium]
MSMCYKSSDDKAGYNTADDVAGKKKVQEPVNDLETNNHSYADESVGAETDFNNMEPSTDVSPIPTTRVHSNYPKDQILGDPVSAVQTREELLQFMIQKVCTLVDLPYGKKAIGTKWVYQNKKDERGIVVRNKARLMDVKSAFLYGTIEKEVYVSQTPGFMDPKFLEKFYNVEKALYGLHQAPRSCIRSAGTPMETYKPLTKDENGEDVDVHLYRLMIMSLMILTSSRPDIMFLVCTCSSFLVQSKISHLHAVKRIFRYLKGQPKLGLWYPKDSPLILEAFSYSDYAGTSSDRKSTIGGCQFLGSRLTSWQCKKQIVVANSTTKAEYIAASYCCGQVLWIQN